MTMNPKVNFSEKYLITALGVAQGVIDLYQEVHFTQMTYKQSDQLFPHVSSLSNWPQLGIINIQTSDWC